MSETSDDDEFLVFDLNAPIVGLRDKIIEPMGIYNYLPICINIMYIVEDFAPEYDEFAKINLACCILNIVPELRPFTHIHFSMIENLQKLANNEKLTRLKKKESLFQWLYRWIV